MSPKIQANYLVAREGVEIGMFPHWEIQEGAAKGRFLPSDHGLVQDSPPRWEFLHKIVIGFFLDLTEKEFDDRTEQERKKVSEWLFCAERELAECQQEELRATKLNAVKEYKILLSVLKEYPDYYKDVKEDEAMEERQEAEQARREEKKRLKVFEKTKKELVKTIKAAKRCSDDADGIQEWYENYYVGTSFGQAAELFVMIREKDFSEADICWLAGEMLKKDDDGELTNETISSGFLSFFKKQNQ